MYAIWCHDTEDWLRELPSKVDDGGEAVLAFGSRTGAEARAAKHYGFDSYAEVKDADWCEVKRL